MFSSSSRTTSSSPRHNHQEGDNPKSWKTYKEEGKIHFQNARYEEALICYQKAIQQVQADEKNVPQVEHEILLSNSVACRLKIGGPEMAFVAVEESKKCIALNNKWSKAHVRLASAYIALGNHSNDACQSLQNAIRLDPSNQIAKQMLMKELRRDHGSVGGVDSSGNNRNDVDSFQGAEQQQDRQHRHDQGSTPIYVNEDDYTNDNTRPSAPPMNQNVNNGGSSSNNNHYDDIDDSPTFLQRIQDKCSRLYSWYRYDASDNWKSLIRIILFILVLYIAFGGRFGLDSALSSSTCHSHRGRNHHMGGVAGDYGKGNAYEQFYNEHDKFYGSTSSSSSGGSGTYGTKRERHTNTNTNTNPNRYYDTHGYNDDNNSYYNSNSRGFGSNSYGHSYHGNGDSNYGYHHGRQTNNSNSNNRYFSNSDWDTIIPYLLVGGVVLGLNRFLGVPIHVLPMGFGMRRGFGGGFGGLGGGLFGPRVRFGRGGMRFGFGPGAGGVGMGYGGGFPMGRGGFGQGGGGVRYGRRRYF